MRYNGYVALSWSARRQLLYYAVGTVVVVVLAWVSWVSFFSSYPTCFDGEQNGSERGVDCGGECTLICTQDTSAPTVLWSRSFHTGGNLYTSVAYIQNQNVGAAAKDVSYSFQLYDTQNLLVAERRGIADLPPLAVIPIVLHNVNVGNRSIARTQFSFSSTPVWERIEPGTLPTLRVVQNPLADNGRRLEVTLFNDSLRDARNVAVAAVLFDSSGTARAAAQTLLERVVRKSSQNVVFTWPQANLNIVRIEITVLPPL